MNKKYSKEELKELSTSIFKANPKAKYVLATRDAQFFLPGKEFAAHNHANANGGLTIHKIVNPTSKEVKNEDSKTDNKSSNKDENKTAKKN